MNFLHPDRDVQLELSLEDVFIVPALFDGVSRRDVSLVPTDIIGASHPVVSANMNAVTGKRMAETMARCGGLGVLPQDMSFETVERIVNHVKNAHTQFDTALTVTRDATLRDVQGIIRKRAHGAVVVVEDSRPVGLVTLSDLRARDQYSRAGDVMSTHLVTLSSDVSARDAFMQMDAARVKCAPVVDSDGKLVGIWTKDATVRASLFSPACDKNGKLQIAAAVGISSGAGKQAAQLVDFGVDVIVLDTAHGHQRRMLESIANVRSEIGSDIPIVAGNVCTAEGTKALIEAGADIIKVNVGPGAMCTTRMKTGAGRPTFSAARACADQARKMGKHIWADGGVKYPRDVALYLAAGASRVMVGTMLCPTFESPGDIHEDANGRFYKENYGMASARAVRDRASELDPFDQATKALFREGISTSKIYINPAAGSVSDLLVDIVTGVQSSFTYVGASDIPSFYEKVVVGVQSASGYVEGTPHGKVRDL